jgi:phosphoenolpyruvate synthase/pyruvate phosphate dikinase
VWVSSLGLFFSPFAHLVVCTNRRSDLSSAGVAFTLDPDSGFRDVVVITGSYGLGESVVAGKVDPDEIQVSFLKHRSCSYSHLDSQPCFFSGL